MDAKMILRIKPELTRFLHQFDDCFCKVTTRRYLDLYIEGQLSDLPRKSLEPMGVTCQPLSCFPVKATDEGPIRI